MSVRGTLREGLLEDPLGREKENRFMKKKIKYTNEKIGRVEVVKDFLPRPDELAFGEANVKVVRDLLKNYSPHCSSKP
jgi:hypothetical protein